MVGTPSLATGTGRRHARALPGGIRGARRQRPGAENCVLSPARVAPAAGPTRRLCFLSSSLSPAPPARGHLLGPHLPARRGTARCRHPAGCWVLVPGAPPCCDLRPGARRPRPARRGGPVPARLCSQGPPKSRNLSSAPTGIRRSSELLGTHSSGLRRNALVRLSFKEQKLSEEGIYFSIAAIRQFNDLEQLFPTVNIPEHTSKVEIILLVAYFWCNF